MADSIDITFAFAPNGDVQAAVVSGATFEQAAPVLKRLFAELGLDNLPIRLTSEPEAHTHGPDRVKVRAPGSVSFGSRGG
jgi:hypothetical protein